MGKPSDTAQPTLSAFTLQGLGNTFLALPILLRLSESYMTKLTVMHQGAYEFLRAIELPFESALLRNRFDLLTHSPEPCNVAVSFYPNWKRELFALWRCRADRKISFLDSKFSPSKWFDSEKIVREEIHDLENNVKILEVLGVPEKTPVLDLRCVPLLDQLLQKNLVALHPTASRREKFYSKEFWIEVIRGLLERDFKIRVFSGASDFERDFCEDLMGSCGKREKLDFAANIPILEVAQIIASSEIFIGLDSSLAHLAALLNCRTLVLWSAADFERIHPYGPRVLLFVPKNWSQAKSGELLDILDRQKEASFTLSPRFTTPIQVFCSP